MAEQSKRRNPKPVKKASSRLTAIERVEATVTAIKDGYVRTFQV